MKTQPQLDARFGATHAFVVDLGRPNRTLAGYEVLAKFARVDYDDGSLAHQMAAAPDMLLALQTISLHAPSLDTQGIRELADAAIAKAEGRS